MKHDQFIKKIKEKARHNEKLRKDPRFVKTIAFLKAKGLLDTNLPIKPHPRAKIKVLDAIWAGINLEPRILEVLPAAILHFPKNFIGLQKAPTKFLNILDHIKRGDEMGPDYEGIEYIKMKFWANNKLKDGRTRPIDQKKRSKIFRLRPETLKKLEDLVLGGKFKDQTTAIEAAIHALSRK